VPYEEAQATVQVITGNPDTVIEKLKKIVDLIDPGYVVLWGREGPMSHEVAMRNIDLMSQEVVPAIKEYQAVA
jgi:alkanesulfonate monooxygenase SsuD/methylene tetrahydromethanopterin reductase-like flavin-dependent oxidoreductase (luciferase family)